jgi:chromosome partitioning protein
MNRTGGIMKTISFLSQKGGSGKTTLSLHTAVAAGECGIATVVIDTDPQASASAWAQARDKETPTVAAAPAGNINAVLDAAASEGFALAVIDAAPHLDPAVAQIASAADFIVIPVRPTPLDIQTARRAAAVARASGKPYGFVLNGCPARAIEVPEALDILAGLGGVVCPVTIGERRAYARALGSGQAVTEFDARSKAADEIRALWAWIDRQANISARKGVKK